MNSSDHRQEVRVMHRVRMGCFISLGEKNHQTQTTTLFLMPLMRRPLKSLYCHIDGCQMLKISCLLFKGNKVADA